MIGSADETERPGLPSASYDLKSSSIDESDRNPVFGSLVSGDGDIVGLIAYSIYKQNKHDWLHAFAKSKGREPDDSEVFAYIVGESTSRRLATYRLLAQATLEGKGPDVHVGDARGSGWAPAASGGVGRMQILGAVLVAAIVGFVLALIVARAGLFSRG